MKNCSFFILLIIIVSGCTIVKQPAPIEYNHANSRLSGAKKPVINNDEGVISSGSIDNSEVIDPHGKGYAFPEESPIENNRKIIYHEVQIGQTIEDIAQIYQQKVSDIAALNDLSSPYYLEEFQIIKIKSNAEQNFAKARKSELPKPKAPDFIPPLNGKIISKFGEKTEYGANKGISIAAKQGTKIVSSTSGKVIYADYDATFGNLVIVKVKDKNMVLSYAHLEDLIIFKGDSIIQGDIIGYVGKTGKVKKPQLNFGVREGKKAKDPLKYVKY